MNTKEIAFGGVLIGLFIAICFIVRDSTRVIQSYTEILKTVVVAFAIRNISPKGKLLYPFACFSIGVIMLPIQDNIIYNVPSIIGGFVIGFQKKKSTHYKTFLIYFCVNTLLIIYEYIVYYVFSGINLLSEYLNITAIIIKKYFSEIYATLFIQVIFIILIIFDSLISSLIIYATSQLVFYKTRFILKYNK